MSSRTRIILSLRVKMRRLISKKLQLKTYCFFTATGNDVTVIVIVFTRTLHNLKWHLNCYKILMMRE
jgi:hypothetical protein